MQAPGSRKLAAVFALSVLFLADAGIPCALFDCASDRTDRHGCCPPAGGRNAAAPQKLVRPACCCPAEKDLVAPLPTVVARYEAPAAVPVPAAPASFSRIAALPAHGLSPGGPEREPGVGPPLILLNRTLLI